ncbi:MAG: helix-turn-helix domain-containing protein, partial [bacterium]|nr:helix-turn-helix domain-containing protein [bacterium]
FERHMDQHPVARHYLEHGVDGPRKISDFVGQDEWHRNPLYCAFYRELGIECQIIVPSGPTEYGPEGPCLHGLNLNRTSKDFSERERALLALLMPHLEQARSRAALIGSLQRQLKVDAFVRTRLGTSLVELDEAGRPLRIDPGASEAFALFFGSAAGRLPEDVSAWLASDSKERPLVREHSVERIAIRDLGTVNESRVLLVEATRQHADPERLRCLGLTRREAETLFWIAQGKSNADVGIILGIRNRTVAKHLEAVYTKLDVDSRTAATLRAIEALGRVRH